MPEFKQILCPVDFSDTSRHAVEHATALGKWYRSRVTALYVYTPFYMPVPGVVPMAGTSVIDEAELARLQADLESLVGPAMADGLQTDTIVQEGSPAVGILDVAMAMPADLIVMGTHGASGFEHLVLGSVTEKVLRKAACPVLTVPPRLNSTVKLPFKRLLCPVDFSPCSIGALQYALSLAQEADATLTLLHVLESLDDETTVHGPCDVPEYRLLREQDARKQLEGLVPAGAQRLCEPVLRLGHGKPYREIIAAALADHASLIVMGVHGRLPLDLVFGSTVNQVVRRASCPVLTVRR